MRQALEIFEQQGSPQNVIRVRISLGRIFLTRARYEDALHQYQPALELIKETRDSWQERVLRYYMAVIKYCQGEFAEALGEALYSLDLCEQFRDTARQGDNSAIVGLIYLELGLREPARNHLQAALRVHQQAGSQWSAADSHCFMGLLEIACRRHLQAIQHLNQARQIARRIGAKSIIMHACNCMALALCERRREGDLQRALDEGREAVALARGAGLIVGEIPGLSRAARAACLLGQLETARDLSRQAVDLLSRQRIIESSEEEIHYTHFRVLRALGDPEALAFLRRAHEGLMAKARRLETAEWERAFLGEVRLNAAIVRDHQRLVAPLSSA